MPKKLSRLFYYPRSFQHLLQNLKFITIDGIKDVRSLVKENITQTSFVVDLEAAITYYWIIVVKDDQVGEAFGQDWSFKNN